MTPILHLRARASAVRRSSRDLVMTPKPTVESPPKGDVVERLATLADLRERGMLDDDEYEEAKNAVLGEETSWLIVPRIQRQIAVGIALAGVMSCCAVDVVMRFFDPTSSNNVNFVGGMRKPVLDELRFLALSRPAITVFITLLPARWSGSRA